MKGGWPYSSNYRANFFKRVNFFYSIFILIYSTSKYRGYMLKKGRPKVFVPMCKFSCGNFFNKVANTSFRMVYLLNHDSKNFWRGFLGTPVTNAYPGGTVHQPRKWISKFFRREFFDNSGKYHSTMLTPFPIRVLMVLLSTISILFDYVNCSLTIIDNGIEC